MKKGELFSNIDLEKREINNNSLPIQILFEQNLKPSNAPKELDLKCLQSDLTDRVQWQRIIDGSKMSKYTDSKAFPASK